MSCRCPRKRPLNETLSKCCQKRLKAPPDVSDCHLNKHRLINALGAFVNETRLGHECPQAVLPPIISPKLPESDAHAGATEARAVRRELGIIRCILYFLLSIVAGFVWRVEGGGGDTKKDDAANRMYVVWDCVTGIAHQGVTFNPPNATSQLSIDLCLPKTQSGPGVHMR